MTAREEQERLITNHIGLTHWLVNNWACKQQALDRDELTSIAYEALHKAAVRFDPDRGGFANFAKLLISHAIHDALRKCNARVQCTCRQSIDDQPDPHTDNRDEIMDLHVAIDELPEPDRSILQDHYFNGYSQTEIARQRNISVSSVCLILKRCRSILHDKLQ